MIEGLSVTADGFLWQGSRPLSRAGRRVFQESLPYVLEGVDLHGEVEYPDGRPAVRITGSGALTAEEAAQRLARAAAIAARVPDPGGRSQRPDGGEIPARTFDPGTAFREVGPGVVVGTPDAARTMETVDQLSQGLPEFRSATPLAVPGLVAGATLDRAGYLQSFPQHVTGCCIARPAIDSIEALADGSARAFDAATFAIAPVGLPPAACHNVYAYLAGTRLDADSLFSVRGSCARYEPAGFLPGRRHWSFTMREFVFAGTAAGASTFADLSLRRLTCVAEKLELPVRLAPASDPFFLDRAPTQTAFQISTKAKYEMLGALPDGDWLALASLNVHRRHFSGAFDFQAADQTLAHTVCVGFGLERWAYWLLSYCDPGDVSELIGRAFL
jgi:hypothetical protein